MSVVVSRQTSDALSRVMAFFGIDEYNRPLFRKAAESCGVDTFERFIGAMDAVVQMDSRSGCGVRIRERIERENMKNRKRGRPDDRRAV